MTEAAVARFIRDPEKPLLKPDRIRVVGYINKSPKYYPCYGNPSAFREEDLIFASIRQARNGEFEPLQEIITAYVSSKRFPALPECVIESVNKMMIGADTALHELRARAGEPCFNRLEAQRIFTESKDMRLLAAFVLAFPEKCIAVNSDIYVLLLNRPDIPERLKESLLNILKRQQIELEPLTNSHPGKTQRGQAPF
jgi:hypothetical protein